MLPVRTTFLSRVPQIAATLGRHVFGSATWQPRSILLLLQAGVPEAEARSRSTHRLRVEGDRQNSNPFRSCYWPILSTTSLHISQHCHSPPVPVEPIDPAGAARDFTAFVPFRSLTLRRACSISCSCNMHLISPMANVTRVEDPSTSDHGDREMSETANLQSSFLPCWKAW
jgi:hypothetical protein